MLSSPTARYDAPVPIGTVKSLYYNADSKDSTLSELNYMETDTLRMYMSPTRELEKIWAQRLRARCIR